MDGVYRREHIHQHVGNRDFLLCVSPLIDLRRLLAHRLLSPANTSVMFGEDDDALLHDVFYVSGFEGNRSGDSPCAPAGNSKP